MLPLALLLPLLAACGGNGPSGPELDALRAEADRLAGPLEAANVYERGQGEELGKQQQAEVVREYALADAAAAEADAETVVERARAEGWEVAEPSEVVAGKAWSGTKPLERGPASLTITLVTNPDRAPDGLPVPALRLRLTHAYSTG